MSKPSQSPFSRLVHHEGHSHFVSDIFIPSLIALSVFTHLSQYPHFRHFHLLNMEALDCPTFRPYNKAGLIITL